MIRQGLGLQEITSATSVAVTRALGVATLILGARGVCTMIRQGLGLQEITSATSVVVTLRLAVATLILAARGVCTMIRQGLGLQEITRATSVAVTRALGVATLIPRRFADAYSFSPQSSKIGVVIGQYLGILDRTSQLDFEETMAMLTAICWWLGTPSR